MTILDPIRRICGLITGPRTMLPEQCEFTLEHLQNLQWEHRSSQEQGEVLVVARAICNSEVDWAVQKWEEQVANRPLHNESRRAMDDLWRMYIRRFGGNPEELLGPDHDALVANYKKPEMTALDTVSPVLSRISAQLNLMRGRQQDVIDHSDSTHDKGLARAKLQAVEEIEQTMRGVGDRVEEALANRDLSGLTHGDLAPGVGDDAHAGPIERLAKQPLSGKPGALSEAMERKGS